MTEAAIEKVREDFNSIAPFETAKWNHNNQYHPFLLANLPLNCQNVLEIGCGIGTFSRLLPETSRLRAIDLSPKMIEIAKNLSKNHTNIDFQVADILETDLPDSHFDAIVSIATFHHLPLEQVLPKLEKALRPGGKLLILDVLRLENTKDYLFGSIVIPLSLMLKFFHNGLSRPTTEERKVWAHHAETDRFLSFSETAQIYPFYFENAKVQRHLFFRYSMIWTKTE
jgi:SAM-dependent methyltransferase